jgi:hypothetical protein
MTPEKLSSLVSLLVAVVIAIASFFQWFDVRLDGKWPLRKWIRALLVCCVVALIVSGWLIIVAPDSVPGKTTANSVSAKTASQSSPETQLVLIGWLQCGIFVAQLVVFAFQAVKLQETVTAAGKQTEDMKRSIKQATRAASATENLAVAAATSSKAAVEIVDNNKDTMTRLLRAYLCVNFGAAIFQRPETNFRFEVRFQLVNAGQTPAYKVAYKAHAAILPFPLPEDFDFSLPNVPAGSESTLGHGQHLIMSGAVDRLYSEDQVAEIRSGLKRLYLFGTATYEDVYRVPRYTNFCMSTVWFPDQTSMGVFTKRHNDAD